MVWPHQQSTLAEFLSHLNGIIRPSIQFTMEEEQDQQIAFLDVLVKREGNKLSTAVYRKKTHTERYLNFRSHHHLWTFTGVVKTLNTGP